MTRAHWNVNWEQIAANNAKTWFVLANKPFDSENSQLHDFGCDLIGSYLDDGRAGKEGTLRTVVRR
jgi:hypothetical protein